MTIAVIGGKGKMGNLVCSIAQSRGHKTLTIESTTDTTDIECDIAIDFSTPTALAGTIAICRANNCPLVCGVTGYDEYQLELLDNLSRQVAVAHRHNFSTGIQAVQEICLIMSTILPHWHYDIVEQHHIGKIDSPSGTALTLADHLAGIDVTTHSIRAGTTIGTHTIIATGENECITITHTAQNREVFALGAVLQAEQLLASPKQLSAAKQ